MYNIGGHQLIVNDYHTECLRKARETEARRDAEQARTSAGTSVNSVVGSAPDERAASIVRPA